MTSLLMTKEFCGYSPALALFRNSTRSRGRKHGTLQCYTTSMFHAFSSSSDILNISTARSSLATASTSSSIDYRTRLMESLSPNERLSRSVGALMLDKRRNWRITAAILDVVFRYLDDADHLTASDADFLFRCCGRLTPAAPASKRVQYLRTLWNALPRLGLAHDLTAYVRLQQMLLQNHQMFSAAGFLDRVRKGGYEPNGYLYVGSIIRCSMDEKPNFEEIDRYVEAAKRASLEKDVWLKTRGAVISAYAKARNTEKLRELLDEAKVESVKYKNPNILNQYYFSCASVFAQFGDMMGMFKMIEQARREEVPLSDYQLLYLVRWLAKGGRQDFVLRVLNYMPKADNWIYRTLPFVLSLAADGNLVTALTVLQRSAMSAATVAYPAVAPAPSPSSIDDSQELLPRSENVYHFLLDLFCLNLPTTQISAVCRRLVDCGYADDAFQLAAVAAFDMKRTDAAHSMLEDAEAKSSVPKSQVAKVERSKSEFRSSLLQPRHFCPALRIRSLLGDVDAILFMLKRMEMEVGRVGIRTLSHYVLRYFYSSSLDTETVFAVFGTVGSRKVLLTAAVCVCLREGDGQRARDFLNANPRTALLGHSKQLVLSVCDYFRKTYDSRLVIDILLRIDERSKENLLFRPDAKIEDDCSTVASAIYNGLNGKISKRDLEDFVDGLEKEGIRIETISDPRSIF